VSLSDDQRTHEDHQDRFIEALESVSRAVEEDVEVEDPESVRNGFLADHANAATGFRSSFGDERVRVEAATDGVPTNEAFRKGLLESLRDPLSAASAYVYGSTPASPDGGRPTDESALIEQAHVVLVRMRAALLEAVALDSRLHPDLSTRPIPQRVTDQSDRLTSLFGEPFVVLPPFEANNPAELARTFGDEALPVGGDPLSAEQWLQRIARVRERPAAFREVLSYAEFLSGSLKRDLTIGQLPVEDGEPWVGAAAEGGVPAGRLSLVVQFGSGSDPGIVQGRMTGLFVDEWVENVPNEEETTGVALNYDDPGNRAPQSILLAAPPTSANWSLNALASTVAETMDYAKVRSVDLGDVTEQDGQEGLDYLLPALYLPNNYDEETHDHHSPSVPLKMLDWYDPFSPLMNVSLEMRRLIFETGLGGTLTEQGLEFDGGIESDGGEE
jgi:hypothetical protein